MRNNVKIKAVECKNFNVKAAVNSKKLKLCQSV